MSKPLEKELLKHFLILVALGTASEEDEVLADALTRITGELTDLEKGVILSRTAKIDQKFNNETLGTGLIREILLESHRAILNAEAV